MAAREGAGRLRWPLSAALRSVHKIRDIKSAAFDKTEGAHLAIQKNDLWKREGMRF